MKICVTQREGIRHFAKFTNLGERDKLYVEVTVEDKNGNKPILIDLTSALIQEYSKHPELGKPEPAAVEEVTSLQPIKKRVTKVVKEVIPAYLMESKKQKEEILSKVREAQQKLADERKCKAADQAKARTERKAKAENKAADSEKGNTKTFSNLDSTTKASSKLTKTQQAAVNKISKVLAEEERTNASKKSSTSATKCADKNKNLATTKTKAKTDSTDSTNKSFLSSANKKSRSKTANDQVKADLKAKTVVQETQSKRVKAASRTATSASKLAASER